MIATDGQYSDDPMFEGNLREQVTEEICTQAWNEDLEEYLGEGDLIDEAVEYFISEIEKLGYCEENNFATLRKDPEVRKLYNETYNMSLCDLSEEME